MKSESEQENNIFNIKIRTKLIRIRLAKKVCGFYTFLNKLFGQPNIMHPNTLTVHEVLLKFSQLQCKMKYIFLQDSVCHYYGLNCDTPPAPALIHMLKS